MAVARIASMRSKDPSTQVGACIVDEENRIVGVGYNGLPRGCNDDELPWNSENKNTLNIKNTYCCHAEANAILNKNVKNLDNCKIYVTLFPCNDCAKLIIQSGIKEVIYITDEYRGKNLSIPSKILMNKTGDIKFTKYTPKQKELTIDFYAYS